LHEVAEKGLVDMARLLLDAGADINARGWLQSTPLQRAAQRGHREMTVLLLEKAAKPNLLDEDGNSALYYASEPTPFSEVIALLEKAGGVRVQRGKGPNGAKVNPDGSVSVEKAAPVGDSEPDPGPTDQGEWLPPPAP
jgi:ankyrin repeat protein